jgi:hypothetical protein
MESTRHHADLNQLEESWLEQLLHLVRPTWEITWLCLQQCRNDKLDVMTNNEPIEVSSMQFETQLLNSSSRSSSSPSHSLPHCIPHSANGHIILNFFKKGPCGVGESNRILRYINQITNTEASQPYCTATAATMVAHYVPPTGLIRTIIHVALRHASILTGCAMSDCYELVIISSRKNDPEKSNKEPCLRFRC